MSLRDHTKVLFADALKDMLKRMPLEKVRIDALCRECGADRRSFYYHFKDNHAVCITMNYLDENGDLITDDHDYNSGSMETFKAICNRTFYGVWSKADADSVPGLLSMEGHVKAGAIKEFKSMSAILETYNLPHLVDTLTGLGYTEDETYYVSIGRPGIYGTMGGIAVNDNYQVVTTDGGVIPGLFATGEVIGRNYGATTSGYEAGIGLDDVLAGK